MDKKEEIEGAEADCYVRVMREKSAPGMVMLSVDEYAHGDSTLMLTPDKADRVASALKRFAKKARVDKIKMRTGFEMTQADLDGLLAAMKPVQWGALQWGATLIQQENANAAWARLGAKMGFDWETVRPTGQGDRFFSAVPTA